eukprot:s1762_g6.t1
MEVKHWKSQGEEQGKPLALVAGLATESCVLQPVPTAQSLSQWLGANGANVIDAMICCMCSLRQVNCGTSFRQPWMLPTINSTIFPFGIWTRCFCPKVLHSNLLFQFQERIDGVRKCVLGIEQFSQPDLRPSVLVAKPKRLSQTIRVSCICWPRR